MKNRAYGKELILDMHKCDPTTFTRKSIKRFFVTMCYTIDMQREDLYFWDYKGQKKKYKKAPAHLKGTSAVQFIKTSNMTIHCLDELKAVYLNIFSCKEFSKKKAIKLASNWFKAKQVCNKKLRRV